MCIPPHDDLDMTSSIYQLQLRTRATTSTSPQQNLPSLICVFNLNLKYSSPYGDLLLDHTTSLTPGRVCAHRCLAQARSICAHATAGSGSFAVSPLRFSCLLVGDPVVFWPLLVSFLVGTSDAVDGPVRSGRDAAPISWRTPPVLVSDAVAGLCPSFSDPRSSSALPSAAISFPVPFPPSVTSSTRPRMTSPAPVQAIRQGQESAFAITVNDLCHATVGQEVRTPRLC